MFWKIIRWGGTIFLIALVALAVLTEGGGSSSQSEAQSGYQPGMQPNTQPNAQSGAQPVPASNNNKTFNF